MNPLTHQIVQLASCPLTSPAVKSQKQSFLDFTNIYCQMFDNFAVGDEGKG